MFDYLHVCAPSFHHWRYEKMFGTTICTLLLYTMSATNQLTIERALALYTLSKKYFRKYSKMTIAIKWVKAVFNKYVRRMLIFMLVPKKSMLSYSQSALVLLKHTRGINFQGFLIHVGFNRGQNNCRSSVITGQSLWFREISPCKIFSANFVSPVIFCTCWGENCNWTSSTFVSRVFAR